MPVFIIVTVDGGMANCLIMAVMGHSNFSLVSVNCVSLVLYVFISCVMAYGQGLMLYVFSIYSISRVQAIGDDGLTNFNEKVD